MEVNGIEKALVISKSTGAYLHGFDAAVDAFGGAIAGFQNDGIQDSPQVALNGFVHVLDRGKSASHGLGQPLLPGFGRPGATHIAPQVLGGFFEENYLDGVGISDCIRNGTLAANQVLHRHA